MAVDLTQVANVDVEPGELPETMAAWVIRQEREGEPMDAFQLEEIEVPEPGAFSPPRPGRTQCGAERSPVTKFLAVMAMVCTHSSCCEAG